MKHYDQLLIAVIPADGYVFDPINLPTIVVPGFEVEAFYQSGNLVITLTPEDEDDLNLCLVTPDNLGIIITEIADFRR